MKKYNSDASMALTHLHEGIPYYNSVVPPVSFSSLYTFDSMDEYNNYSRYDTNKFFYGRMSNPTVRILEKKIAELEHALDSVVFSSGMAAAVALVSTICEANSKIVAVDTIYGPFRFFLEKICYEKYGITTTFVSGMDVQEFKNHITDQTDLVILESPSSIIFRLQDLKEVSRIAKSCNAKTYIDNTYCTPLYQNPLDFGIDFVMHTISKYISGHSDVIAGVIATNQEQYIEHLLEHRRIYGSVLGPMEAWLALRGMRTLEARIKQISETTLTVATFLENHSKVKVVHYPNLASHPQYDLAQKQQRGSTGLFSFELNCSSKKSVEFVEKLKIFKIGCSWGEYESLVLMPEMKMSEQQCLNLGISQNIIRMYCGLENVHILLEDIKNALDVF